MQVCSVKWLWKWHLAGAAGAPWGPESFLASSSSLWPFAGWPWGCDSSRGLCHLSCAAWQWTVPWARAVRPHSCTGKSVNGGEGEGESTSLLPPKQQAAVLKKKKSNKIKYKHFYMLFISQQIWLCKFLYICIHTHTYREQISHVKRCHFFF